MITQLKEKSALSNDQRSWKELMQEYPQVRGMLYSSRRLFKESAEGCSHAYIPWHSSLVSLTKRQWTKEEAVTLIELMLYFLNDDFVPLTQQPTQ